jgi:hypothetical protein
VAIRRGHRPRPGRRPGPVAIPGPRRLVAWPVRDGGRCPGSTHDGRGHGALPATRHAPRPPRSGAGRVPSVTRPGRLSSAPLRCRSSPLRHAPPPRVTRARPPVIRLAAVPVGPPRVTLRTALSRTRLRCPSPASPRVPGGPDRGRPGGAADPRCAGRRAARAPLPRPAGVERPVTGTLPVRDARSARLYHEGAVRLVWRGRLDPLALSCARRVCPAGSPVIRAAWVLTASPGGTGRAPRASRCGRRRRAVRARLVALTAGGFARPGTDFPSSSRGCGVIT